MKSKNLILGMLVLISVFGFSACGNDKPEYEKVNIKEIDAKQDDQIKVELENVFTVEVSENETWTYYLGADQKRYIFPNEGTY